MTNILQTLAVAATLITVTVAASSSVLAGADSPFYPAHFKNPNLPYPSVGREAGYRPHTGWAIKSMGSLSTFAEALLSLPTSFTRRIWHALMESGSRSSPCWLPSSFQARGKRE